MARHTTVGSYLRIGVVALLGAGLFAPGLGGALHGIGAPAVAQASATINATAATPADDSAATATEDRGNGSDDGAATTSTPAPSETADRGNGADDQNGTGEGSHDRAEGSGDEGVSDEGAFHDGQFGHDDESEVELHHEETNQVNAGSNTFEDDTMPAQSAPQVDQ
jgi:hypothetical protein